MDQNRDASTKNLLGAIHASSDPKKWAFLQATYSCPELIELESPPMVFLEHSGFDQRNAANRLINYWDLRVMTFGTDRAFRSVLNLSGTQALSPVAVEYLSTGFASFLPRDDQGRTILFLDRSLIPTHLVHIDIGIRHEATFYALSKAMQNNTRRLIAIIFFTIKPQFFPGSARWFLNAIAQAFPLQLDAGVIACRSPRSAYKRFVATFVPVILRLISAELSRFNITIDIGEKEDLLKKLIQRGMVADHLPVDVGGTWKGVGGIYSLQHEGDGSCNGLELLVAAVEMDASLFSSPAPLDTNADECSIIQRSPDIHDSTVMALQNPQDDTNDVPPFQEDSQATSMDWSTIVQAVACLPPLDIAAFVEASSVAMDRMKAESNLNVFLTLENGDVNAAAKRVASYWKVRKMFFMDRAFLPLNQTGVGALNDEDLRTLKSGYITLLPKDSNNRIMICYDASRLDTGNEESRLRCLVYMLHVASDGADSNVGINFLFVMNKLSFERTRHFSWLPQLLTILPTKIEVIHIVRQPARLGESVFRDKVVPTLQSLFQKTNTPLQTYSGTPDCDLRTLLKQSGLQVECLPQSLGGGWTYQDFQQWMNKRLLIERKSVMRLKETTNGETDHANVIRRPAETDLSIVRYVQSPSFAGDISLFPYGSCPQSSGSVGINSQLQAFLYQTQHTLPKHHLIQVHPTTSFLDYSSLQSFANRAQYDASCRAIFSVANKATAFHVPYSVTDGHSHPLQHRAQQVSPSTSSNNLQDRRSQAVESPRK